MNGHIPMTCRCNEIEAAMDTPVLHDVSDHTRFSIQILLILGVNVLNDWLPASV